ncbi:hypothetical protein RFI_23540 [Reticulomyxa filosa]|uniref:Endonuclease/exonuclease/phosphatase domain-containing protein n=1 Tax=Reticulomyxa filosa TaxID=46433 RepID=X6ML84_RETFI|nr:hypothetical protein RFI_23540 [Reticulomyxa filosa]|eukprot:ETO13830.1 hypothetical protein RFI_23540 [Reticulomyxa filosa]
MYKYNSHEQFANENIMTVIIHKHRVIIIFINIPPNDDETNDKITITIFQKMNKLIQIFNILKYSIIIIQKNKPKWILLKQFCQVHQLKIYKQRTYHNFDTVDVTFSIVDYIIINNYCHDIDPRMQMEIFTCSDHFPIKLTFNITQNENKEQDKLLPKIQITIDQIKLYETIPDIKSKILDEEATIEIYGNNKKEKESINESILNTIKITNICIKYNASKHLLKHNISKYELQKEQQQSKN